jgi:hypothetical protein
LTYLYRPHYDPDFDSVSNINDNQEYFLKGKGSRFVGLTTLPPSCTVCQAICEPQPPGTLRSSTGLYRDWFTLNSTYPLEKKKRKYPGLEFVAEKKW